MKRVNRHNSVYMAFDMHCHHTDVCNIVGGCHCTFWRRLIHTKRYICASLCTTVNWLTQMKWLIHTYYHSLGSSNFHGGNESNKYSAIICTRNLACWKRSCFVAAIFRIQATGHCCQENFDQLFLAVMHELFRRLIIHTCALCASNMERQTTQIATPHDWLI